VQSSLQQAYRNAVSAVATATGTKYADVYQYMVDNGGDTLIGADGVHPNDAGHAAIAAAFLSVL
jgi:lysophospholipase L1-like esterase